MKSSYEIIVIRFLVVLAAITKRAPIPFSSDILEDLPSTTLIKLPDKKNHAV